MLIFKVQGRTQEASIERRLNIITEQGNILDQTVIIQSGTSYMPVRDISKVFDLRLLWIESELKAVLSNKEDTFEIFPHHKRVYHNGERIDSGNGAFLYNNQTYISLRQIGEALGYKVEWVEEFYGVLVSRDQKWVEYNLIDLKESWIKSFFESQDNRTDFISIKVKGSYDYKEGWMEDSTIFFLDVVLGKDAQILDISGRNLQKTKGYKILPFGEGIFRIFLNTQERVEYFLYHENEEIYLILGIEEQELVRLRKRINGRGGLIRDREIENSEENLEEGNLGGVNLLPLNYDPANILIVIDPGHGGSEPGAVSRGVFEKDLNLDIALKLNEMLINREFITHITRTNDSFVSLQDRAKIANDLKAEIFVSIHHNALTANSHGTETLFLSKNNSFSEKLAKKIQEELVRSLNFKDRGIIERPGLAVLRQTNMPAVLVEIGFMSNQRELEEMMKNETKDKAASAILQGILGYFSEVKN
jgi:N-acetylmuramoyl-L-alanine amidase